MAFSQSESTRQHLLLSWGVTPYEVDQRLRFEELVQMIRASLLRNGDVKPGERIVITAGSPRSMAGETNLMVIESA
jgi:pyruvate kinase